MKRRCNKGILLAVAMFSSLEASATWNEPFGYCSSVKAVGSALYYGFSVKIWGSLDSLAGELWYEDTANYGAPESGYLEQIIYNQSKNTISFRAKITNKFIIKFIGKFSEDSLIGTVTWYQAETNKMLSTEATSMECVSERII